MNKFGAQQQVALPRLFTGLNLEGGFLYDKGKFIDDLIKKPVITTDQ